MPNMLMLRYAGSRGENRNESRNEMRNEMGEEMRRNRRGEMMAGEAQPNHQVGTEQRMAEDREYRGNRRSQNPWSEGEAEMRYRGEDGRYKSGRRSSMDESARRWEVEVEPKGYQVTEPGKEHIEPYQPKKHEPEMEPTDAYGMELRRMDYDYDDPTGRVIGFRPPRNHYASMEEKEREMRMGKHHMEPSKMDRETAEYWVENMENEDQRQPTGGKWEPEFMKTMAQKLGVPTEGEKFWEFYAMTNAMYSDYSEVLKKYGTTNPMAFAEMAKAWMNDKDAVDEKTMIYYECIVKPKMKEGA